MSSSSFSGSNNKGVKCRCGIPVALLKSWTQENPGRRFMKCKFSKPNSTLGCGYFQWYDEEQSEWQRTTINQLVLEKKVVDCELMMMKRENEHLLEQNQKLKEATAMLKSMKAYDDDDDDDDDNGMVQENRKKKKSKKTVLKWVFVVVCVALVLFALVLKP